jgi:hypothetical protein
VRAAVAVKAGMRLDIEFTDGRVSVLADGDGGARGAAAAKARFRRGGGQGGGQGSLFGS